MQPSLLPEPNTYNPKSIIDHIKGNLTYFDHEINKDSPPVTSNLTQMQCARCVIENSRISFDPRLHTFTTVGSTKPHVVILHPKESLTNVTQCNLSLWATFACTQLKPKVLLLP